MPNTFRVPKQNVILQDIIKQLKMSNLVKILHEVAKEQTKNAAKYHKMNKKKFYKKILSSFYLNNH